MSEFRERVYRILPSLIKTVGPKILSQNTNVKVGIDWINRDISQMAVKMVENVEDEILYAKNRMAEKELLRDG